MTVTLNDTDISRYIQGNSFVLTSAKAEVGQVLINPIPSLVGIDTEGFWNPNNPASVFFGVNDYSVYTIKIIDDGLEIFNGSIQNITRNPNGTANVSLQTELQKILEKNIIYSSGENTMNPAGMFIEVCDLFKIKYDPVSTLRSSSVYELDEIRVSSNVLTPDTSILSFLETLAQTGVASIYAIGDYLYFAVYESGAITNPVVTLENTSDSDEYWILTKPAISSVQKDIPTGYSITYNGVLSVLDLLTEFGDQSNSFSLSGGLNDLITIRTLQSAIWAGEQTLEYSNRADTSVSLEIGTQLARDLLIGYPMRLVMNDNTIPLNFIISGLITLNSVQTQLRGTAYGN